MAQSSHHIYLLRHGEVDGPAALYGSTDVPLSEHGWQQLKAQSARLPDITQVCSSPLQRCRCFAQQLCDARQLPLQIVDELRECDFGKWDGVAFDDIPQSAWPELEAFWQSPTSKHFEGGEPLQQMYHRVTEALDALMSQLLSQKSRQSVLIVTHGGVIRLLLAHVLKLDWQNAALFSQLKIGYASLSKLSIHTENATNLIVDYIGLPAAVEPD